MSTDGLPRDFVGRDSRTRGSALPFRRRLTALETLGFLGFNADNSYYRH
jgi:hypothetical protein